MDSAVDPIIHDVWSRTAPKYRTRAVLLLIANMLLFGALCSFMFWLRTGWFFPPTYENYSHLFQTTLNITGESQITLYDLLTKPISLKLVPMQAVVIGLLIASLVSIPILVAILYRWPASLPFCAMVGLLAVMPWLGATLVLSCAIAAWFRIRLKFRFVAALLGLVPIGVYFFTASQRYAATWDVLTPQIERGLVVAPLLLSAIACCTLMGTVLFIARVVNYRPGAIAPLLAVMFLTPWFVFITKVGRDELHYRLLELNYGPRSEEFFASADINWVIHEVALRLWFEDEEPRSTIDVIEERVKEYFELHLDPVEVTQVEQAIDQQSLEYLTVLAKDQYRVVTECKKFLEDFPKSRYVPSVLFIQGRALDMRVDISAFRRSGVVQFYTDFPNEASRATWSTLTENYSNSPLADVARYRLAQLDARASKVDQAIGWLSEIVEPISRDTVDSEVKAGQRSIESLFQKKPPEDSLEKEYVHFSMKAAELLELLSANREPINGDAPLVAYMNCDPRHGNYHQNLKEIVERFPRCKIEDNVEVQLALKQPFAELRIAELQETRVRFPKGDAQAQILFHLGMAHLNEGQLADARAYFDEVIHKYPSSSFASVARRRLPLGRLSGR